MPWVQIEIKGTVWAPDDLEEGEEMTFVHDKLSEALVMYDDLCEEQMKMPPDGKPPEEFECIVCSAKPKTWADILVYDAAGGFGYGGADWQFICRECDEESRAQRPARDDEDEDEDE